MYLFIWVQPLVLFRFADKGKHFWRTVQELWGIMKTEVAPPPCPSPKGRGVVTDIPYMMDCNLRITLLIGVSR